MGFGLPRRTRAWTVAALIGATLAPVPAFADRDGFYIRNQAGVSLTAVYVSPIFSKRWRDDRLSDQALAPGGQAWVVIDESDGDCFFDIRVEDADGKPYELWGVDLCATRTVTVP